MNTRLRLSFGVEEAATARKLCNFRELHKSSELDHHFHVSGERNGKTILVMIDNTARMNAEAKVRKVEADFSHAARLSTLGEMTTSIAHEIKQPLSAILMNAQTSLRHLRKAEPNLDKVEQLTSRIAEICAARQ